MLHVVQKRHPHCILSSSTSSHGIHCLHCCHMHYEEFTTSQPLDLICLCWLNCHAAFNKAIRDCVLKVYPHLLVLFWVKLPVQNFHALPSLSYPLSSRWKSGIHVTYCFIHTADNTDRNQCKVSQLTFASFIRVLSLMFSISHPWDPPWLSS